MNQNALQIFITLYENQNMHRTAELLYISQQAISKQIRSLEAELDLKLFERTNSGVQPTEAGEAFYQEAKIIQKQYSILHKKMDAVKNGRKVISLVCAYGTLYHVFPALKKFEQENPNIEVRWKELPDREVEQHLIEEDTDLAVNVKGKKHGFVEYEPLYDRQIVLLVYEGHRLYNREFIVFEDLDHESIILEGEDFQIYSLFKEFCERAEVYPKIIAETSDISFCQHMAEMREGLAVSIDFLAQERKLEHVRAIPFDVPEFRWEVGLEYGVNAQLKEENALLIRFLRTYFTNN